MTTNKTVNKLAKVTMSSALVMSSFSFVAPLASAQQLKDVDKESSHYENIAALFERNIVSGYPDGTFKPNQFVTRGQAAKIIANILELNTEDVVDPGFSDISKENGYYGYIAALAQADIIHGWDGKYNPNNPITRGQMAKIIARAFKLELEGNKQAFDDIPTDHEYAPYINTLAALQITTGKSNGKFEMHDLVTRGQLASFVVRAEKATRTYAIEGTVEKITSKAITIDGKSYAIPKTLSFLGQTANRTALAEAGIQATVKNNELQTIEHLTLTAGKTLDGKGQAIGTLVTPTTLTTLENITADQIEMHSTAKVKIANVTAKKLTLNGAAKVASITPVTPSTGQYQLEDSTIDEVIVGESVTVNNTAAKVQTVTVMGKTVTLNGVFNKVIVPNNGTLYGTAQIDILEIDSKNNETPRLSIAPTVVVADVMVRVAGITTTLQEALESNLIAILPTTPGGETGGSTPTTPGGETGGSTPTTPGGETGGSTPTTPGGETGGSTPTTPGGETGGSTPTTPGGETGGSIPTTPSNVVTDLTDKIVTNEDGSIALRLGEEALPVKDEGLVALLEQTAATVEEMEVITENGNIVGVKSMRVAVGAGSTAFNGQGIEAEKIEIVGKVATVANVVATGELVVEAAKAVTFQNVEAPAKVEVTGDVEQVTGLTVTGTLTVAAAETVTLQDVKTLAGATVSVTGATNIIVDQAPVTAILRQYRLASLAATPIANVTGEFSIAFANTAAEVLTVKRQSSKVDIQSGTEFNRIEMLGDFAALSSNLPLASVFIGNDVTSIKLDADVATLSMTVTEATKPIKVLGTGKITMLDVNIQSGVSKTALIDIREITDNITTVNIGKTHVIFKTTDVATPIVTLSEKSFGRYTLEPTGAATIAKYKQVAEGESVAAVTYNNAESYSAGSKFTLYHSTKSIVVFENDSNKTKHVIDVAPRSKHTVLQSFDKDKLTFVSTFKSGKTLAETLKYLVLVNYGVANFISADELASYKWTLDSKTGLTTATVNVKNSFLNQFMIASDGQVEDYMPANSKYHPQTIVSIANVAQQQGDASILYGALVNYALAEGTTFDGVLLQKYVDAIVGSDITISTVDDIKNLLDKVEQETPYDKDYLKSPTDFHLANDAITFEYLNNDENVVTAEIQGGKILFVPVGDGKVTIKMTDSTNNTSLVCAEVASGKITKVELVAHELSPNHSIIENEAAFRVVEKEAKRYVLPTTLSETSAVSQNATTPTELNKITVTNNAGALEVQGAALATLVIPYADLGLTAAPTVLNDGKTGTVISGSDIHLYAIAPGTSNHVFKMADNKATAVQVVSDGTTVTLAHTAKTAPVVNADLGLSSIDPAKVENQTTVNAIHATVVNNNVTFYGAGEGKTSFKLTDVAGKTAVMNVESVKAVDGKVNVTANAVTQNLPAGSAAVVHISGDSKAVHAVGSKLVAANIGAAIVTLADGTQYEVEITFDATTGYTMTVPKLIENVAITPQMVDLSSIDGPTGVSYASIIEGMLIVKLAEGETEREIVVTSGTDTTQKAVIVVTKDADGKHTATPVRDEIIASDVGMTEITGIEGVATSSYRVVENGGKVYVYGFGTTGGTYKIIGKNGSNAAEAHINITPAQAGGKYTVTASAAKHELLAGYTLAADADGNSIVRIDGNNIYALKEGYVELQLDNGAFYTFTVSKASNGHFTFSTPIIVSRATFNLADLGLATISGVNSNDADVATAAVNASNQVVVSTGTKDGTTQIHVTGTYNGATVLTSIFVKRNGNTLTAAVEKMDGMLNFADFGHTTLASSNFTWLADGIVRPTVDGTTAGFFVIGDGATAAKVESNVTTLVNFTASTGTKGERVVVADVKKLDLGSDPTIVSGTDVVRIGEDDQVYATKKGTALVKVGSKVYEVVVDIVAGKTYTMTETEVTSAVTVLASVYGLTGNITDVQYDENIVTVVKNGNELIVTPKADGKTALVMTTATGTSIVNMDVTDDVVVVEDDAVATTAKDPVLLHEADQAIVRLDGETVYAVGAGVAEMLVDDAGQTVVAKVVVEKAADGTYTITEPETISEIVLDAAALGLGNTISLGNTHETSKVHAEINEDRLVAYGKANGSSLITVQDTAGNKTIVQVKQVANAFEGQVAKVSIDATVQTNLGLSAIPLVGQIAGKARFANGELYLLEAGFTHATFTAGTEKVLGSIKVEKDAVTGWLSADIQPVKKTVTALGGAAGDTLTVMANGSTNENIVRIVNNELVATGLGSTQVKLGSKILAVTVAKDAVTDEVKMTYTATSSIELLATEAGLDKITGFTEESGSSLVTGVVNGDDFIFYAKPGMANATSQVRVTNGTDSTIVNIHIDANGNLTKAEPVTANVKNMPNLTTEELASNAGVRAVWNGTEVNFYATEVTPSKSIIEFTGGTANVEVKQSAGIVSVTVAFVTHKLTGTTGITVMNGEAVATAEVGADTIIYAKKPGTALLSKESKLYVANVTDLNPHVGLTVSEALTFDKITAAPGTYTVASVTGTKVGTSEQSDDELVLYSEANGKSDITVTSGGLATVYHVETANKVTTATVSKATLPSTYTNAEITSGTAARLEDADIYFLHEGNIALETDVGLFNGVVSRGTDGKFTVDWTPVTHTLKEAIALGTDNSDFTLTDKVLTATDVSGEEVYYATNYRVVTKTVLNTTSNSYELTVHEQPMAKDDYTAQGLAEDKVKIGEIIGSGIKAEVVDDEVIVYATTSEVTSATITVTDDTNSYSIYADFDGTTMTLNVVGTQVTYDDLGITGTVDLTKLETTINSRTTAPIRVEKGVTGLNISAQSTGEASITVKYDDKVVGIVNVTVTQAANLKYVTTPTIVKATVTGTLISGNVTAVLNNGNVIGEGTLLYDTASGTGQLVRVMKDANGLYHVETKELKLNKVTATDLGMTNLTGVEVVTKNDTVANAIIADNNIYMYNVNAGTTNVHVRDKSTFKDVAIVQVTVDGNGVTPTVAVETAPTGYGTMWTNSAHVLVREGKLFAINEGTSTVKVSNGTNTTLLTTTVSIVDGKYKIVPTPVKLDLGAPVTVVTGTDIVYANGNDAFAQKAGVAKVEVGGKLVQVTVTEKADGTFTIEKEATATVQKVVTAADVGLTEIKTAVLNTAVIETQLAEVDEDANGKELIVLAKQPGEVSFEINDGAGKKAIAYAKITSTNGELAFVGEVDIAKVTVADVTFETNDIVRANGDTLYAQKEGETIVNATEAGEAALYKVKVTKTGEKLAVQAPARIETADLGGEPTGFNPTVARKEGNKLVVLAVGKETEFTVGATTYRLVVSAQGDVTVEQVEKVTVDVTGLLADVTAVSSGTIFTTTTSFKVVTFTGVTGQSGTEYASITDGAKSIQVKVDVASDGASVVKAEPVKETILATDLGFYVDETKLPVLSNAVVKYNAGNLDIYPGKDFVTEQFVIHGKDGKQAIYELDVTALGSYTLKPLVAEFTIDTSVIDIVPTRIVTTIGTAKPKIEGNKFTVQFLDTNVSHVVVANAEGQYRTIDVQATGSGTTFTPNPITAANVQKAISYDAPVTAVSSKLTKVTDGAKDVLFVTDTEATEGSFLVDDKLYNVTIEERVMETPVAVTQTSTATVASTSATFVTGNDIAKVEAGVWYAKATGKAVYKTNDGHYVEVEVTQTDEQYAMTVNDLASATILGLTNIQVIEPTTGLATNGSDIYGNVSSNVIVKGLRDGKAVMYAYDHPEGDTSIVDLSELKEVVIDINTLVGWTFTSTDLSVSSTTARLEGTKLYITDFSTQSLPITFTGVSGLTRTLTVDVTKAAVIEKATTNKLVELVTQGTETLTYSTMGNAGYVTLTFNENVDFVDSNIDVENIIGGAFADIDSDHNVIRLTFMGTKYTGFTTPNIKIKLPEWGETARAFDMTWNYVNDEWEIIFTEPVDQTATAFNVKNLFVDPMEP